MDLTKKSLTGSVFNCKSIKFNLYDVKYDSFTRKTKLIINATAVISHFNVSLNASSPHCSIERFEKKESFSETLASSISYHSSESLEVNNGYEKTISGHG